jgi:hypothetical protein
MHGFNVWFVNDCSGFEAFQPYKQKPAVVQVIKGFCAKSDGKDKLTALVQVRLLQLYVAFSDIS